MDENLKTLTLNLIEESETWFIDLRRDLHQYPELGNEEYKTTERICYELEKMGIEVRRPLNTGALGILKGTGESMDWKGGGPDKTIAFRGDIDALPIHEQPKMPFSSVRDGLMHACGHDAHTAILLGTAKILCLLKSWFKGTVKFIFQPAEETTGGALPMIRAGCLKDPEPDHIFALHVMPDLVAGMAGIHKGRVHPASDMFTIKVKGIKSHGASPHQGIDAIVVASQIVNNIQAIISRNVDPLESAIISIGRFQGGHGINIVADEVVMEGTIRAFDASVGRLVRRKLREISEFTAKAAGAISEIQFQKGYGALTNHPESCNMVELAIKEVLGEDKLVYLERPTMGVDDFSAFLIDHPGAMFFLGSGFHGRYNPPIHTDNFQINEKAIGVGIAIQCAIALNFFHNNRQNYENLGK
ncbi:MAG: M20 metallopeptidase family protein [Anaerovoracaceae bacterium]